MVKSQQGFSVVVGLLVILAVSVISLVARQVILTNGGLLRSSSVDDGTAFSTQLSPKDVEVEIANTASNYTKERFIDIKLTIRNVSNRSQDFPSSCAEKFVYFVDDKQKNDEPGGSCAIGYPPLNPKSVTTRADRYDPIRLEPGEHTLQVRVNGILSNKLKIFINNTSRPVKNCYEYVKDITPLCKNIVINDNGDTIHVNAKADLNTDSSGDVTETPGTEEMAEFSSIANQRCEKIKQLYFISTQLQPIPKLSTVNCDKGKLAKFVANVPPSDFKGWWERIKQSDPAIDLATGNPTQTYFQL